LIKPTTREVQCAESAKENPDQLPSPGDDPTKEELETLAHIFVIDYAELKVKWKTLVKCVNDYNASIKLEK
jgi:hypothetical protein